MVSDKNLSKKRSNTANIGAATAKLSKTWRKAIDAARKSRASTPTTTKTSRSAGPCINNNTPEASEAARFTRTINEAVFSPLSPHNGWEGRHRGSRYRSVKVLLTYWAETDDPAFGAAAAARALADVFQNRYGFDVLVWLIPIMQPQQALAAKLRQFARDTDSRQQPGENLLIFWYGGPAREDEIDGGPALWFGDGPTINSQIVPQILGAGKSDVLTLYDSPHALHGYNVTGPGLCEHLGAAAYNGVVAGFVSNNNRSSTDSITSNKDVNYHRHSPSFTRALIQILDNPDRAAQGLSVLDIHRKLVNRYNMAAAAAAAGGSELDEAREGGDDAGKDKGRRRGVYAYLPRTRPWLPSALRQTPTYCHLSRCPPRSEGGPASIVLARLGRRQSPEAAMSPTKEYTQQRVEDDEEESEKEKEDGAVEVTMRLRLRPPASTVNVGRWKEWILNAPAEATKLLSIGAKPT
ncbi:hypothetical protein PG993_015208 [Apiospora rasikravindrae]|uniref:Uncharacterized protein n=1 Tax=Apiospora rasikravindrae TaxID=990691 RepID=A0ABR1RPY1_9PEZI